MKFHIFLSQVSKVFACFTKCVIYDSSQCVIQFWWVDGHENIHYTSRSAPLVLHLVVPIPGVILDIISENFVQNLQKLGQSFISTFQLSSKPPYRHSLYASNSKIIVTTKSCLIEEYQHFSGKNKWKCINKW